MAVTTRPVGLSGATAARESGGRRTEILIVGAVFLALWSLVAYFLWSDIYRHSDTAALVYMTEATGRYGVPYNQISISDYDAGDVKPLEASAACAAPLVPGPESYPNGNFSHFEYHAYYFVYVLAPLTWLMPTDLVIAGTQSFAMVAILLLVYVILRQERVGIAAAGLFCAFVATYPVWNEAWPSTIDLYMDRYFPPLALVYLAMTYYGVVVPRPGWSRFWPLAVPVGILAASTNDRSMLYVVAANIGMLFLLGRRALTTQRRAAIALVALSIALLVAFVAYMNWVHTSQLNTIPGFAGRIADLVGLFASQTQFRFDQTYAELSLKFLVLNLLLFGMWGFWRWKLMLIALAAALPNILTTIGGAEKIQFGFHYHAQYLPFIILAAALGFARVWRSAAGALVRVGISLALVVMAAAMMTFDPYQPGWVFSGDRIPESGLASLSKFYFDHSNSDVVWRRAIARELDQAVPKGVAVTSPPSFAGVLYPGRHWFYYPIAMESTEYAVVPLNAAPDGTLYFGGAESYLGQDSERQLNQCLSQRLARDGYNVANPQIIGNYVAVLHRAS